MVLKRRLRLLILGFFGSIFAGALLMVSCLQAGTVPVVASVGLEFPLSLEGTPLTVLEITGYEGAYVEDGSDEEVVDVAAILVKNTGTQIIKSASIALKGEETMRFTLTYLPPGETVIVLEESKLLWLKQTLTDWEAWFTQCSLQDSRVQVKVAADGFLEISNLSDIPVDNISLMHKTWSEVFGGYLGGITYQTKIHMLQPGQLMLLRPDHFAPGSSRIVAVVFQEN